MGPLVFLSAIHQPGPFTINNTGDISLLLVSGKQQEENLQGRSFPCSCDIPLRGSQHISQPGALYSRDMTGLEA